MAKTASRKGARKSPARVKRSPAAVPRNGTASKPLNRSLEAAKASKQDEFYTQLSDIEKELKHYTDHFKGKTVLCNCDDPLVSNFFHYFSHKFHTLKLKKLITTCYRNRDPHLFSKHDSKLGTKLVYEGEKNRNNRTPTAEQIGIHTLEGDGDFRSDECIELLGQADIVVTNPPFSLFREYVQQLIEHNKNFVIIGNQNAISYKEIFSLIQRDKIWLGYTHPVAFVVPDHYEMREVRSWRDENGTNWRSLGNACWFTNLDIAKRHEDLVLYKNYSRKEYPKYKNYDAIEVSKYLDIPCDYDGPMGVPVTFLDHYNPQQFEILGSSRTLGRPMREVAKKGTFLQGGPRFYLANGDGTYRRMYDRLVIKNKCL
jgi:hypothetical protein